MSGQQFLMFPLINLDIHMDGKHDSCERLQHATGMVCRQNSSKDPI